MFQFDEKGHLAPYEILETTLDYFEAFFVGGLENRAHRQRLFVNYLDFLERLKKIVEPPFYQWIDGSFVTLKANPKDFDVLTFVDYDYFEPKKDELIKLRADARLDLDLDANFAFSCEPYHPEFATSLELREFWKKFYGFGRRNPDLIRHPKGMIQLNFSK